MRSYMDRILLHNRYSHGHRRYPRLEVYPRRWNCIACCSVLYVYIYLDGDLAHILFFSFTAWAAFINTVGASGISDLLLTAIVMAFSFLGFVLGLFEFARIAGLVTLGISGGLALGIRLILLKQGLLLSGTSLFAINWVLITLFGVFGGMLIAWPKFQRAGIVGISFWTWPHYVDRVTVAGSFSDQPPQGRS